MTECLENMKLCTHIAISVSTCCVVYHSNRLVTIQPRLSPHLHPCVNYYGTGKEAKFDLILGVLTVSHNVDTRRPVYHRDSDFALKSYEIVYFQ